MTADEIKKMILIRLHEGAFKHGVSYELNLNDFASEKGIDKEQIWKIYDDLEEAGLIRIWAKGGLVAPTSMGLSFCEENKLVDDAIIREQNEIRIKILEAYANIYDEHSKYYLVDWQEICRISGVSEQDFQNNIPILFNGDYLEKDTSRAYTITQKGLGIVRDYKRKNARLRAFENLENLVGTTHQSRGHQLEDILADIAGEEGWDVEKRVRSQGQEHDIIIHKGFHYFLISCKWESDPVQGKEVELLESRVRSRASTTGGILFSMSDFTENCIKEAFVKISSARIMLFGSQDVKKIMLNKKSLTDLIDEKLERLMHQREFLVDGIVR
jgi:predicted transcriptional regulator